MQSRYYNPEIGRFINADNYAATGQGFIGNNMFIYCLNNPINRIDPSGKCSNTFSVYFKVDCNSPDCRTSMCYNPSPLKSFLSHMARRRENGCTVSAGFTGGGNFGGATSGKTYVLSWDNSYNYACQESTALGSSIGSGGSAGFVMTYTNAPCIQDLNGESTAYGITLVGTTGLSIDLIEFIPASNPDITCWGINIVVAIGAEAEAHASKNYTTTISDTWNPFVWLEKLIYGG